MGKFKDFVEQKKVQIGAAVGGSGLFALAPSLAFAAEDGTTSTAMTTVTGALGSSISDVAANIGTAIGANLPVILGVASIFIVIPAVWKLAKRFTK